MSARRYKPVQLAGAILFAVGGGVFMFPAAAQGPDGPATTAAEAIASSFDIPAQDLGDALTEFARQSGQEMLYAPQSVVGKTSHPISGELNRSAAMSELLKGTGLQFEVHGSGSMIIGDQASIQSYRERLESSAITPEAGGVLIAPAVGETGAVSAVSAAEEAAALTAVDEGPTTASVEVRRRSGVEEIIVTAQKRAERIQDIPIAISAFTQEDLTRSQIAGGPDLITQIPNFTFTKTNFSGYSIQIRGIGTQAISATTDPAVAVAFNNTPFIRNRFFEQEFYDLDRVEVLRGPQGTLYGRNATAGVVNLISAKPEFFPEARASVDIGNYNSHRLEQMVNIPLVEDAIALRFAGAWTKRDGYATNDITGNPIDGRDLWSTRTSLRIKPNDIFEANLVWEHFEENDDRLRSGKQLCDKDVVTEVAGWQVGYLQPLTNAGQVGMLHSGVQATLSQGCKRGSLYAAESFQTPNGLMLPYYVPLGAIGLPRALNDPYLSTVQSRDLRVIESTIDPQYRAKSDIGELQINVSVTDNLTITSETAYSDDSVYSMQDFNRFNTAPGAWDQPSATDSSGVLQEGPNGGIFCDPQLGCSDRLVAVDISTAESRQFSQELRLASSFDGPFNFSLGANYLRYSTEDKYYVFFNSISLIAAKGRPFNNRPPYQAGITDNLNCMLNGYKQGDPNDVYGVTQCVYIDPNPLGNVNDEGHNYFLSKNPYLLESYAAFGETYFNFTPNLKLTAGLRWSVDRKTAPRVPTWILGSNSVGYPVAEVIRQEWREPTGRVVLDWKPDLSFTDETLLYASFGRGYKAGGANPPGYVRAYYSDSTAARMNTAASLTRPKTFAPEFVNAFEIGAKNTLLDGSLTANLAAFYYNYKDYQISEIVDRSAFNRNFDAQVWGLEVETDWYPVEFLRLSFKGGYQKTRIDDGEEAIDLMDRTAGNPDWVVVRPFPTYASSCILPEFLFNGLDRTNTGPAVPGVTGVGAVGGGGPGGCELAYVSGNDPVTNLPYVPNPTVQAGAGTLSYHPGYIGWDPATAPNNGEGFAKDLGGNELPNAPNFTATISSDLTLPLANAWTVTLHTDVHWQSKSWWRVFNDHEFGRLDDYYTANFAAIFVNEPGGWNIMAYVKNVFDETAISGAFLNSDDTGLTTNVFLTEPRLFGLRVTKSWTDSALFGNLAARRSGPGAVTLEVGGQVQRSNADNTPFSPTFEEEFAAPLDIFGGAQNENLGWGQTREIALGWRPDRGPWLLSVGYQHATLSNNVRRTAEKFTDPFCPMLGGPFEVQCTNPNAAPAFAALQNFSIGNHVDAIVFDSEGHSFFDIGVSRDLSIAGMNRARMELTLRRARFRSSTDAEMRGVPDWYIPENADLFPVNATRFTTHTVYRGNYHADRSFRGTGPVLTWEASNALFGNENVGRIDLDWSVSGGVLFGRQNTEVSEALERAMFYRAVILQVSGTGGTIDNATTTTDTVIPLQRRSESVVVPMFGGSVGLTYRIGGASLGAGYRWERYVNVIDGGVETRQRYDRTIDGPTMKLTMDFGG
jgi:outer membrane receptor protein involved in Fe transport